MKIWDCKIGECDEADLPPGSDAPMRAAVAKAYKEITGKEPRFCFSGWGGELTDSERAVVEQSNVSSEGHSLMSCGCWKCDAQRKEEGITRKYQ